MSHKHSVRQLARSLVVLAVLCLPLRALADEIRVVDVADGSGPNLLLFNAGDLINGIVSFEYERALSPFIGIVGGLSFIPYRGAFTPDNEASVLAVGPELGLRLHFIRAAPAGLWLGPYIGGLYIASGNSSSSGATLGYDVGAALGYNFVLGRHFVVSVGAGGGINDYGAQVVWAPRFRLALGGIF